MQPLACPQGERTPGQLCALLRSACAAQGHGDVTHLVVEGTSHFDVLDGLAQGDGPLFAHARRLLGL